MKVCIVANKSESDVGLLEATISDMGSVQFLNRENASEWRSIEGTDLFIHLGSSWSVYWDSVRSQVDAEVSLMRHSIERGVPMFGICFGAQMLSHAYGGIVERGKKTEIGWHDVVASATFDSRWTVDAVALRFLYCTTRI